MQHAQFTKTPNVRSVIRWLGYHKPHTVSFIDDQGQEQKLLIDSKNRRWAYVAFSELSRMNACTLRALDPKGAVLASMVIRTVEDADEDSTPQAPPATQGGYDVAAVVDKVADAFVKVADKIAERVTETQKVAFQELVALAKQSTERALIAERERMRYLDEREKQLDDERERLEDERDSHEREREREKAENAELKEMFAPLLAAAAPKIVDGIFSQKNGAPKVAAAPLAPELPKKEAT